MARGRGPNPSDGLDYYCAWEGKLLRCQPLRLLIRMPVREPGLPRVSRFRLAGICAQL